jgi:hypothetical protein
MTRIPLLFALGCFAVPLPAHAGELFGGLYVHDIDSPLTKSGIENGMDVQLGYRWASIGKTPIQPYVFGTVNTSGETHYAVAGLSAKFGGRIYIRPGLGLAVHSGDAQDFEDPFDDDIEFGSTVLFAPELGIGFAINESASVEASIVHLSHAQFFGGQNPGIDNVGVRFNWKL